MQPDDAVRQMEYVIDANLDEVGHRNAGVYEKTFERIARQGGERDLTRFVDQLGSEVCNGGRCPNPEDANRLAEEFFSKRAATDGGEDASR